jgi:hypothetical protein
MVPSVTRFTVRLLALALAAFSFGLVPADAGQPKVDSTITYKNSVEPDLFVHKGWVKSALGRCVRDRVVKLRGEGVPGSLETTETNRKGKYRFEQGADGVASHYYTVTPKKTTPNVVCKAAESPLKPLS